MMQSIHALEELAVEALDGDDEALRIFKEEVLQLPTGTPRPDASEYPAFDKLLTALTTK